MNCEPIEVSAGLVKRKGKLLIARRKQGVHLGGLWEFPGGKREPGESFEACLVRELKEELGIVVSVGEEMERLVHCYPEKKVELRFFLCEWIAGEPRSLGCDGFAWVLPGQLNQYRFPEADHRLIERLRGGALP